MKAKHAVTFMGAGMWKDQKGELWGKEESDRAKVTREFENDLTKDQFLASRPDMQFMVEYGQMSVVTVELEEKKIEDNKSEDNKQQTTTTATPTITVK